MHEHEDDRSPNLGPLGKRLTRQAMLRKTAGGAAALGASGWLLAACGGSSSGSSGGSEVRALQAIHPFRSGTKNRPITLPISSDNPAIASGKSPEAGPLVIYDWDYYLSPAVIKSFGAEVRR